MVLNVPNCSVHLRDEVFIPQKFEIHWMYDFILCSVVKIVVCRLKILWFATTMFLHLTQKLVKIRIQSDSTERLLICGFFNRNGFKCFATVIFELYQFTEFSQHDFEKRLLRSRSYVLPHGREHYQQKQYNIRRTMRQ